MHGKVEPRVALPPDLLRGVEVQPLRERDRVPVGWVAESLLHLRRDVLLVALLAPLATDALGAPVVLVGSVVGDVNLQDSVWRLAHFEGVLRESDPVEEEDLAGLLVLLVFVLVPDGRRPLVQLLQIGVLFLAFAVLKLEGALGAEALRERAGARGERGVGRKRGGGATMASAAKWVCTRWA